MCPGLQSTVNCGALSVVEGSTVNCGALSVVEGSTVNCGALSVVEGSTIVQLAASFTGKRSINCIARQAFLRKESET